MLSWEIDACVYVDALFCQLFSGLKAQFNFDILPKVIPNGSSFIDKFSTEYFKISLK